MSKPQLKPSEIPYYATKIAPETTKFDIERLLKKHGIQDIRWTTLSGQTTLEFIWKIQIKGVEKQIVFQFKPAQIPAVRRSWSTRSSQYEKVIVNLEAQGFRLLFHYLENKLWAVKYNLETVEKEFLSHAVVSLPDGTQSTIGEQITQVYERVSHLPALEEQPMKKEKVIEAEFREA
jgi:hypothetical protein